MLLALLNYVKSVRWTRIFNYKGQVGLDKISEKEVLWLGMGGALKQNLIYHFSLMKLGNP